MVWAQTKNAEYMAAGNVMAILPGCCQPCENALRLILRALRFPHVRLHKFLVVVDCLNKFHMLLFALPCFSNDLFVDVEGGHKSRTVEGLRDDSKRLKGRDER